MSRVVFALLLAGCVGHAPKPTPPPTSREEVVRAERVEAGPAPAAQRWVELVRLESSSGSFNGALDEAGRAWAGWSFWSQTPRWLPFSEPLRTLVFVRQSALQNMAGARSAPLVCGRTASHHVECVFDLEARGAEPRETWRYRLPFDGEVTQLGVAGLPPPAVMSRVLCGVTARGARCWTFDWGVVARPYSLPQADAEAIAAGVPPHLVAEWQRAEPALQLAQVRKVVSTDADDPARRLEVAPGAVVNAKVHCALLESGVLTCYGPGAYGELGDDRVDTARRASRPLGGSRVVDVASLARRLCAVLEGGAVACWGDARGLPFPPKHRPRELPLCPFDRAASEAEYLRKRQASVEAARECGERCRTSGERDACLGCVVPCTPVVYRFEHPQPCQEPRLEAPDFPTCHDRDTVPWPTAAALERARGSYALTFSPVALVGISDAAALALPGRPEVCVLRHSGALACTDDDGVFRDVVTQ